MEDFGGHSLRENAILALKKYGPMTTGDITTLITGEEVGTQRFQTTRNKLNTYFKEDIEKWGNIEKSGFIINPKSHNKQYIYKWVGN